MDIEEVDSNIVVINITEMLLPPKGFKIRIENTLSLENYSFYI